MLLDASARETRALSGTWQAIPDPYGQFGEEGPFGGHRIYDPDHRIDLGDAHIDDGYEISVPGCWNEELPGFERYEDAMWYSRRVDWDDRTARSFIHFGAANYHADVWLNGVRLGRHEGGFTPFAFEVTDQLEAREDNLLVVRVDDSRTDRKLPAEQTDWFTFGGLTREVELLAVPRRFLRNVKVETARGDGEVDVTVRAWVDEAAPDESGRQSNDDGTRPQVELPDLDYAWTLDRVDAWEQSPHIGTDEVARGTVYAGTATIPNGNVDLWRPEDPQLYELRVAIDGDELSDQVGLRTISIEGSDVLLNGNPIELRGISLHEEAEGRGRSLTPADREERIQWLSELGCNFARLAHYPHHPAMARRADDEGILLWAEVPAYWFVAFDDSAVQANYRQQLRELIQRDWNRASVALWSIANETDHDDDSRNRVLPEMAEYVRGLDGSRLVTAACFMDDTDDGELVVNDPLAEHLDVFGVNEYYGWYYGDAVDIGQLSDDPSGPPILITEVGASAKRGNHGASDKRWTEQYQARLFRDQLDVIDEIEQLCGFCPWLLFDFRSPRRQNPLQRGYNRKGLIDENGNKKAAFDVLRQHYLRQA